MKDSSQTINPKLEKIRHLQGSVLDFLEYLQARADEDSPGSDVMQKDKHVLGDTVDGSFNDMYPAHSIKGESVVYSFDEFMML